MGVVVQQQEEVEGGRMITKSGLRLEVCMMLLRGRGVVAGEALAIVRLWRRTHRGRVMSTTILEVAMREDPEGRPVACRADPGEAVYLVVPEWDGEEA
jgi:hypothetical protein